MSTLKTLTVNDKTYKVVPIVPTASVTLLAAGWVGSERSYSQKVKLDGVTPNTKVDLQPTPEQDAIFYHKALAFVAENDGGAVTVYSIGDKPQNDYTIQVTMTEVVHEGPIRGNTVGLPNPQADWNQTDPTKADYIKNKPSALDGKSAYEYAKDGGYTGTEAEFAEKLAEEIPDALPNPYPLKINGKPYNGSEAVDVVITGGTAGGNISLGQTPVTLTQSANIKLVGDGDYSYTIKGKTIADMATATVAKTNVVLTEKEDYVELTVSGSPANWYGANATFTFSGLTVDESYTFCIESFGLDTTNLVNPGYFLIRDANETELGRIDDSYAGLKSVAFTATTESISVRWYPATAYYWNGNYRTARIGDFYINKTSDGTERTDIINESGTFTDSYSFGQLQKGITITSDPSCEVYSVSAESESGGVSAPLAGKTVVCFGDSLFGMYTGDTSAPAFVAQKTGATVHNVGFGGCRMSEHPYTGYNEFCMYALANAIASGDWSLQDAAASKGSANFPDQLAILKSIDFSTVDYIVIHYGTNDFTAGGGVAIDNASSPKATNTLCGALRHSIEKLLGAYPKLQIFVSLPVYRFWAEKDVTTYAEDYVRYNHTLMDFGEALRNTAAEYNLPVIDGFNGMGVNRHNASVYLSDGTHHNVDGRKLFGEYIGAKLISGGDVNVNGSFYVNIYTENGYSCTTPISTLDTLLGTARVIEAKITTDTGALFAPLCSYETSADNSYGRIVMFALGLMTIKLTPTDSGSYEVAISGD